MGEYRACVGGGDVCGVRRRAGRLEGLFSADSKKPWKFCSSYSLLR